MIPTFSSLICWWGSLFSSVYSALMPKPRGYSSMGLWYMSLPFHPYICQFFGQYHAILLPGLQYYFNYYLIIFNIILPALFFLLIIALFSPLCSHMSFVIFRNVLPWLHWICYLCKYMGMEGISVLYHHLLFLPLRFYNFHCRSISLS